MIKVEDVFVDQTHATLDSNLSPMVHVNIVLFTKEFRQIAKVASMLLVTKELRFGPKMEAALLVHSTLSLVMMVLYVSKQRNTLEVEIKEQSELQMQECSLEFWDKLSTLPLSH